MLDRADKIRLLIRKYLAGDLSAEEKVEFDSWLSTSAENQKLLDSFTDETLFDNMLKKYFESARLAEAMPVPDVCQDKPGTVVDIKKKNTSSVISWVAASILVLIGFSVFYNQIDDGKKEELPQPANQVVINQSEIMPANGSAILMLDNGSTILLDSRNNGTIATDGGKRIVKQGEQLSYEGKSTAVARNTLFTTKGNVMNLTLADGSKVSLNAESSIQYPTEFNGSDRVVEVTGVVRFKVAEDVHKPFRVFVKTSLGRAMEVEVLGTDFNVNAYGDKTSMLTTLLKGKIKVSGYANNDSTILKP